MKLLRTFILVLLTVLLPLRGAVAAAMLCPGAASMANASAAADVEDGMHGMHGMHDMHDMHAGHHMGTDQAAHHDHATGLAPDASPTHDHASACTFCADGGCCAAPLAFAPPTVSASVLIASTDFPAQAARIRDRHPDGQDRPPRTR